ncbi:MAG: hypothetical protein WB822_11060, partial [Rhodoplanes sp.]
MRFNHLLAGSAIALVLTAGVSAHAGLNGNISLDGVPQIEPAKVTITPNDINRSASADPDAILPAARKDAVIPLPVPAEVVITPADIAIEPASKANAPRTAVPGPEWVPVPITPDDAAKGQN